MTTRPLQLFVTDMDGTLLGTDSRVSAESARIISGLSHRGALITVATARTPATVEPLLSHTVTTPPAIVLTGAALWDRTNHRFISSRPMSCELAEFVTDTCRKSGLHPMTYTLRSGMDGIDMIIDTPLTPDEQRFVNERRHLAYKKIRFDRPVPLPASYPRTILTFALGDINLIYTAAETLRQSGRCSVSAYPDIFNPDMGFLEVFAPQVSKAQAVTELKTALKAEELIVFGDNYNDLPMMRVADRAIAVGNAMEAVKEEADEVIGPNSADSVARYILDHFRE